MGIFDEGQLEQPEQQEVAEIGRVADLSQIVQRRGFERVAAPVGGQRQREQESGERAG